MRTCHFPLLVVLGLCGLLGSVSVSAALQPDAPEGPEVLARGPVHEGYAEPVNQQPPPAPVVPKAPPEPVPELPPEEKPAGDNVQWVPGYWAWDDDREDYLWVSGFWRAPPPDRQWVPGHWQRVDGGWQWVPGFWNGLGQNQLDYLPPPPAPLETGPSVPAPSANSYFVPGCWVYRETRYVWRPGVWIDYRPGWVWVPPRYVWNPCGYVFVDGYWDYPLANRGLLFAPAYFHRPLFAGASYTPRFAVSVDFLLGSLFVRPATCHYYFGDYFAPRYTRAGFVPWVDYRYGHNHHDPLFSYYRHRHDADWERGVRGLYADRFAGRAPLPARTLVQQNTLIQNLARQKNVSKAVLSNLTAVAPVTQVAERNNVRLRNVARAQRLEEQKQAQRLRELARERQRQEAQLLAKGPAKSADPPRRVRLNLPQVDRPVPAVKQPPKPPRPARPAARPEKPDAGRPPRKDVPPPRKDTPPPKAGQPLRKDRTPPKKDTSPPRAETPPRRKASPPPRKEVNPPAPKPPSPPARREPPPRKDRSARSAPPPRVTKPSPPAVRPPPPRNQPPRSPAPSVRPAGKPISPPASRQGGRANSAPGKRPAQDKPSRR